MYQWVSVINGYYSYFFDTIDICKVTDITSKLSEKGL